MSEQDTLDMPPLASHLPEIALCDHEGIGRAVELLLAGEVVAIPTETVYGLAADATFGPAVARIYEAKQRPSFNPLICHVSSKAMAANIVVIDSLAHLLMDAFWPGPLTLVLPQSEKSRVSSLASAGLNTLGVRCPDHPAPRAIAERLGRPIAAPSANMSGRISPTRIEHVQQSLAGRIKLALDGGPCQAGLESTIIAVHPEKGLRLLRAGPISPEDITACTGQRVYSAYSSTIRAPGMLTSHYAPRQPMRLNALEKEDDLEIMIGFGPVNGELNLSPRGDLTEAAAKLFDLLHEAEKSRARRIAVAPIPDIGLGIAINDRLTRAAAKRRDESLAVYRPSATLPSLTEKKPKPLV